MDTKRLPLLAGETKLDGHEYLFVGIDDYCRELYVGIYPDKSMVSGSDFPDMVLKQCPYTQWHRVQRQVRRAPVHETGRRSRY
jgi:hypothetical protein